MISSFISASHDIFWKSKDLGSVEEAEIICMGEAHTSKSDQKNNASLIDNLMKSSDFYKEAVVLVEIGTLEKIESKKFIQTQFVEAPIKCKGWDINRTQEQIEEMKIKNDIAKQLYGTYKKRACFTGLEITQPRRRSRKRQSLLNKLLPTKIMYYRKSLMEHVTRLYNDEKTKKFMTLCCKNSIKNIEQIETLVENTIKNLQDEYLRNDFQKRNNSMIETIAEIEITSHLVFVIAGKSHFGIYGRGENFNRFSKERKEKLSPEPLYNFLNTKKAIILSPKN